MGWQEPADSNQYCRRKSILIIGAGHVISVKEMLKQVYPELHVVLMYEE